MNAVFGQALYQPDGTEQAPATNVPATPKTSSSLPRFGMAVGVSPLGPAIQAATAVSRTENVRFGFNYFNYSASFGKDGINYSGTLNLRSAEVIFDQNFGPFHISPGLMFYDGNGGTATANVSGGQSFSLGGSTYYSDTGTPVTGTGQISSRKFAPELMIGFGNLLPRSSRHFTANFEMGVVFQGSPNAKLSLAGTTCASPGSQCVPIASNPSIQANIASEQTKINNSLAPFKYYPIIRLMFGYKF